MLVNCVIDFCLTLTNTIIDWIDYNFDEEYNLFNLFFHHIIYIFLINKNVFSHIDAKNIY